MTRKKKVKEEKYLLACNHVFESSNILSLYART